MTLEVVMQDDKSDGKWIQKNKVSGIFLTSLFGTEIVLTHTFLCKHLIRGIILQLSEFVQ